MVQKATPPPQLQLGYTILYVDRVEETIQFYKKAFGLKRRFIHESGYGELETGQTTLAFCSHELAVSNGVSYQKNDFNSSSGFQISFTSEDVGNDFQSAVDNGAVIVVNPKTPRLGDKLLPI